LEPTLACFGINDERVLRRGRRPCQAGWLGGLTPIADFNPLLQMASGVYLTFFDSFVFGKPGNLVSWGLAA
jgi:hypothetical protein